MKLVAEICLTDEGEYVVTRCNQELYAAWVEKILDAIDEAFAKTIAEDLQKFVDGLREDELLSALADDLQDILDDRPDE